MYLKYVYSRFCDKLCVAAEIVYVILKEKALGG